ncbi:MAG: hypothetical protein FWF97_01725 [Alphaproteobacteria bacterium]|nr:hypothetical protein [Alphaproteobacteria bacterium]
MIIHFVTTNKGKLASVQKHFESFSLKNHKIIAHNIELIEPQADTVKEVSLNKAKQAFSILKQPVLVNDSGFCIKELNNIPGPYTKYFLDTIGIEGILKIMDNVKSRDAEYISASTFINEAGEIFQFDAVDARVVVSEEIRGSDRQNAWSDLWKITMDPASRKTFAEMTDTERNVLVTNKSKSSLYLFAQWFADRYK